MDNNKNASTGEWIFDKKERETICLRLAYRVQKASV